MSARIWAAIAARLTPGQRKSVAKLVNLASPPDFLEYARSLFPNPGTVTSDGRALLQNLVIAWGVLLPDGMPQEHALEIANQAQRVEAIDVQLIQILNECAEDAGEYQELMIVRGLDLIDNLGPKHFLMVPLVKFMRHPSPKVRSKAAKLIGQLTANQFWIDRNSAELDPRVRSNLLEAIAQNPEIEQPRLRALLHEASRDPHRRVSVTALYFLAKMGDEASLGRLNTLHKDSDPAMRKSAEWALSQLAANS